jgi:hypothetical protein
MTETSRARLISAYRRESEQVPPSVDKWETVARSQPDAQAATMQLVYELLLQVRVIKLILLTVLVIVPLVVIGGVIALAVVTAPAEPTTSYYGF